ncbi:MAG: hypothetical protein FI729_03970 [SAR202 cluster bacterium]|nr:hypothetical protein [SAR202 cluster bacterium]|tara:strand:- start:4564 stop:5610 length:1047 start_codon:yes stop_codon:yes gene_type:complete
MANSLLWFQLVGMALIILFASKYLVRSADIIALETGMGRSFVGVLLLATATSLPELATGVSSIILVGEPDLAAGDAFGSNLFNLLIIGILDLIWKNGPILGAVGRAPILVAFSGSVIIGIATLALLVYWSGIFAINTYVSPMSILLILVFLLIMYMVFQSDKNGDDVSNDMQQSDAPVSSGLSKASILYAFSAGIMVLASIFLARTGDSIAIAMNWHASFVGTQFLAFSTSLPELATSFAAVRIGAPELAISNVLGSNVFNMGFVLFIDDLVYTDGPIWSGISPVHMVAGFIAILMTLVVIGGIFTSLRKQPNAGAGVGLYAGRRWTLESITLILLYIISSVAIFNLS